MTPAERDDLHRMWLEREGLREAPIEVQIVNVETGERRTCDDKGLFDISDGEFQDYIWSEGNYSCDCNRALFFARAGGEDDPNHDCGSGAFLVEITGTDGSVLYRDACLSEAAK